MRGRNEKRRLYWQIGGNLLLGLLFALFAVGMTRNFVLTHRASSLLLLLCDILEVLFVFTRHFTKRVSVSTIEWFVAMIGTYFPLLLRPTAHGRDNPYLVAIQVLGILVTTAALLSLNRSFGIVPADRGIKTNGLYRVVRHPLYTGYIVSIGAFAAMNSSPINLVVYLLFVAFLVIRLLFEEAFLLTNAEYSAYLQTVRWRLIPFVF